MRNLLLAVVLAAGVPSAAPAQESQLVADARATGRIGERYDGYVGVLVAPSPALRAQIAAINIKRRSLYSSLAARRGVAAHDVGLTAACTLLSRVGVNEAYLLADGTWRRRNAGESAPRPDYCG